MDYNGIDLPDPVDGDLVIGAITLLKVMKADGNVCYRELTGDSLHPVEMLGMVETFRDTLKAHLMGTTRRTD